jgi:hypothetical protein
VTLTVTDTGNHTSAPVNQVINVVNFTVVEQRVMASSDDAEEFNTDTSVHLGSSDLELTHDSTDQTVGMRWTDLNIPAGSTITTAYIQFSAKESQSTPTSLTIRAQAADNASTFQATNGDISTRTRTASSTAWAPVAWTSGEVGANQRTPDLATAVQEVVSRPGWTASSALARGVPERSHTAHGELEHHSAANPAADRECRRLELSRSQWHAYRQLPF